MKSGKSSKKKLWIILGVVVVVGALVIANVVVKRNPKGVKVDVGIAKEDSLVQTVTASGKIQPKVDVNISANVSGRIVYLGAEEGDRVKAGELLVKIEDENYAAQLEQMRYGLASSEASLDEAKSKLKRVRELHTSKLASDADLESADATVKRLMAEVDRARANVSQAEDNLSKTRIHSPINGTVTRLNKEVGEMAIGATFSEDVIMVVSRLDSMEVQVQVNENDVVLVKLNDPVKIEVFAMPDTSFHGKVYQIAHSGVVSGQGTAEEVTNFDVKVAVTDSVPELRPGMSATVEIVTDKRNKTLVLPQEAVAVRSMKEEDRLAERARSHKGGGKKKDDDADKMLDKKDEPVEVVFVVENDTAWAHPVKLGIYSDTHFEILSGVEPGQTVVTGPFRLLSRELHSGDRVTYTPPMKPKTDDAAKGTEGGADAGEGSATASTE